MATALSLAALAMAVAPGSAVAIRKPDSGARPDLDVRTGKRAPVPAATAAARTTLDKRLGDQGTVLPDAVTGGVQDIGRTDGFLTGPSSGDPATVALDYVRAHAAAFGLDGADLGQLRPGSRTVSDDGVTHLTWHQSVAGIAAYDSALFANVTARGQLINVGGAPVHDFAPPSTDPPLGPGAARAAAQRDLGVAPDTATASIGTDPARTTTFTGGDHAGLVTVADPAGDRLAWKLTVAGQAPYTYEVLVDAATGAVIARHSLTVFASAATVVQRHPGAPFPGGASTPVNLMPWLTTPLTGLVGPNVHAYPDRQAPNGIDGDTEIAPNAGTSNFVFPAVAKTAAAGQKCPTIFGPVNPPCTWDGSDTASANDNVDQVTTQVFYLANKFHDWLAQPPIGFTPASYNFQGDDPVLAETDDYEGFNNSNFTTPPDGQSPRMQMYLFKSPFVAVNGGDDASVVYHEYTHGLSSRLVGNDGQADGLLDRQSGAMGEGWSDWYAMDYLAQQALVVDTPAPGDILVGDYVTNDTVGGIRINALDCPVGPASPHCPGNASAGPGGFTFADMGRVASAGDPAHPYFEVHADGEIWAETLWDLRQAIGGNDARALITRAMRLSPKQPSFLTMRDAILQADMVAGGTHKAQIWQVFANRGMGYGATTTSANAGRGASSFITPPVAVAGAPNVQDPPPLGNGNGVLEPGESVRLGIPLTNVTDGPLTNVRATLTSSTADVAVDQAPVSYGAVAANAGADGAQPFAVTVPASVPCTAVVALTLTVTSDQGTLTVPVSLPLGSGSGTADSTDVPKTIDDNNRASDSATSTLAVTGAGRAGHVRVTISIAHTFVGDLHGWLISPAGTVVNLFEDVGLTEPSSGDGFSGVVLDDGAAGSIQDVPVPDGPALTGTYSPDEPLGALAGESRTGTWTLKVVDDSARDVGSLSSWSLSTDDPVCGTPPAGAPSSGPGSIFSLPKSRLTGFPKSVTLDRRGRITLRFTATPASTAGSLSLRSAQRVALTKRAHKRLLTAGSATFSVPKTTRVRLRLRVSATARSYLRRHRSLKTRAVLRINGTPFTVPLMLKAHK